MDGLVRFSRRRPKSALTTRRASLRLSVRFAVKMPTRSPTPRRGSSYATFSELLRVPIMARDRDRDRDATKPRVTWLTHMLALACMRGEQRLSSAHDLPLREGGGL